MDIQENTQHVESNDSQTTSSLFEITKSVHFLPRELRDMIYAYILMDNTLHSISNNSNVRLDKFPCTYEEYRAGLNFPPRLLPDFMDTTKAFLPFVRDIVEIVYDKHPRLFINMPSEISNFLDFDFFDCGLTPRQAQLSSLHISGILEPGFENAINLSTLQSDLDALLHCSWKTSFSLEIAFYAATSYLDNKKRIFNKLAKIMLSVSNIVCPFIEKARARGAIVSFKLFIPGRAYYFKEGQNNMLPTQKVLAQDIETAFAFEFRRRRHRNRSCFLDGPCWIPIVVSAICCVPIICIVVVGHGVINYSIDTCQKRYKECKAKRQQKYGSMWSFKKK